MYRVPRWAAAALLIILTAVPAARAGGPNVILLVEDADADALSRNSGVVRAVLDHLGGRLLDAGFAVYDATAVLPGGFVQDRTRRGDRELIEQARAVRRPPLDVAVLLSVTLRAARLSYTTKVTSRITGRLVDLRSGRRLGTLEVRSPQALRAVADCDRDCALVVAGRDTARLARDLGPMLARKLASQAEPGSANGAVPQGQAEGFSTGYSLVFEGYSADEMLTIEEYLVVFSGYEHHRPIGASKDRHEYWYESRSPGSRLNRNLKKMVKYLEMDGDVRLAGNVFTVERSAAGEAKPGSWDDW